MGCDIHIWAEVLIQNEWAQVGSVFQCSWYDANAPTIRRPTIDAAVDSNPILTDQPYDERNYNLFAILAGVRNGRGFAGCDTGDGFVPIAQPRGVPEDASVPYKREVDRWAWDGHSHSWLTLSELKNFDWNQTTTLRGWVTADEFQVYESDGHPESYSGRVMGDNVRHVTNEEMRVALKNSPEELRGLFTQVSWEVSYADCCSHFLSVTVPVLERIAALRNVEDIRIVFFFDN